MLLRRKLKEQRRKTLTKNTNLRIFKGLVESRKTILVKEHQSCRELYRRREYKAGNLYESQPQQMDFFTETKISMEMKRKV